MAVVDRGENILGAGVVHVVMTYFRHRRGITAAHAGRSDDAKLVAGVIIKCLQQRLRARHFATQAIAYPHGNRRWRYITLF